MDKIQQLFINSIKAALLGRQCETEGEISSEDWQALFALAVRQKVLPMVIQSVYAMPQFAQSGQAGAGYWQAKAMRDVMKQTRSTQEFLSLYRKLAEKGLEPIVVKGIVLRQLYPQPDDRPSGDEDLLIPSGSYGVYRTALLENGLTPLPGQEEDENAYEVGFAGTAGRLRLEVHRTLFPDEESLYSGLNGIFADAFERSILAYAEGAPVRTLCESEHLLYLILHAYKHFLSGGFGLRQLCDMVMFANANGEKINWEFVRNGCKQVHAEIFAASLFRTGREHLVFDDKKACYPDSWRAMEADPDDLLQDMLDAGIYGAAKLSRKHSSNITIGAVESARSGKRIAAPGAAAGKIHGLRKALFPSAEALSSRYPYLKEKKYLLPAAWISRILRYSSEVRNTPEGNDAAEALKIGSERIGLLKKYGIIR